MRLYTAIFSYWIPLAIAVTLVCGLIYFSFQQDLRMSANDPQIQIANDVAESLGNGRALTEQYQPIDIAKSLSPFLILYDEHETVMQASGLLNENPPELPKGVFDSVRQHGEDRFTWQPARGVRVAAVITSYHGSQSGFVLAGRSLREVERQEDQVLQQVGIVWVVSLIVTLLATIIFSPMHLKKK